MKRRAILASLLLCAVLLPTPSVTTAHAQPPTAAEQLEPSRRHSALLISGISSFATSYAVTALSGWFMASLFAYDCEHEGDRGCAEWRKLYIPLVGPWLGAYPPDTGSRLVLGGGQAIGLVLTLVGAYIYAADRPSSLMLAQTQGRARLHLSAVTGPSEVMVTARLRF